MKSIEFYTTPQGEVEIKSTDGVRTYTRECKDVTTYMYAKIEEEYPAAHRALCAEYKRSADNPPFFKYLVVHRFMRCNFGRYDHIDDIDAHSTFHFERVDCPLRDRECKLCGVICMPQFNTKMSEMQIDIMARYTRGVDCHLIADQLNTSYDNVRKHIAKCYAKVGATTRSEFSEWAAKHNIFQTKV